MNKVMLAAIVVLAFAGCTDAEIGKFKALGDPARVILYSGGVIVQDLCSTGKVRSETNSDGYSFINAATGRPIQISGVIAIEYNAPECSVSTVN